MRFGAGLLVPLQGAASGCCCWSGVCILELACWCRSTVRGVFALWSWPVGVAVGCCRKKRRALGHLGRRQKNLLLSGVYAGVMFVNVSAKANPR